MKIPAISPKKRARIEIIPLIDIVFFLLATFVMVSLSMVKNQGIPVNLPAAATGAQQERKSAVTVTVSDQGQMYLGKEKMRLEDLASRLKAMKEQDPDLKVFIHGDSRADFGGAVAVLDEVRKAGIAKVAIQTAPEPAESSAVQKGIS